MKELNLIKTTIAAAALALLAGSALAIVTGTPSTPTPPKTTITVTGTGSNVVQSSTAAGAHVNGAGSSISRATNEQTASAYVGGSGSFSSKPANAFVSIEDCAPAVKVSGTQTLGSVTSFGGTSATGNSFASNVSTGAGTGGAQATGVSLAEVAGKTALTSPNMNLTAEGTAFSGVATNTGAIGANGSGTSSGATSSAFRAGATGSLFQYTANGVTGDVKSITSNSFTRVGGIPQVSTNCGTSTCMTGPSVTNNAVVEGDATANAGGEVKANIIVKP